jgi:hypothetical protein
MSNDTQISRKYFQLLFRKRKEQQILIEYPLTLRVYWWVELRMFIYQSNWRKKISYSGLKKEYNFDDFFFFLLNAAALIFLPMIFHLTFIAFFVWNFSVKKALNHYLSNFDDLFTIWIAFNCEIVQLLFPRSCPRSRSTIK